MRCMYGRYMCVCVSLCVCVCVSSADAMAMGFLAGELMCAVCMVGICVYVCVCVCVSHKDHLLMPLLWSVSQGNELYICIHTYIARSHT